MVCPKVTSLALAKSQPNANIWMALDARASGACVSVNNRLAASNAYRPQRPHRAVTGQLPTGWHALVAPVRIKAEPADFGVSVETHKEEGLFAEATSSFEPDRLDAIAPLLKTLSVVGLNLSGKYVADLEPSCRGVGGN
jgi:hypothetical protein